MRFLNFLILVILILFLVSCTGRVKSDNLKENENWVNFKNERYGFSFSFPQSWTEVTKDLPDKWAILDNEDTIIFTVNKADSDNLMVLGKIQAIRDLYPNNNTKKIEQEKVDEVNKIVNLKLFNNKNWYTYAIEFSGKNVNSIVSGTLCGEYEINLVMVSSFDSYEKNKIVYGGVLDSFKC